MDASNYKQFLLNYMELMEKLVTTYEPGKDAKPLSELRLAERAFNFLLNNYPETQVKDVFGYNDWNNLKIRRDKLASKVADIIESKPEFKERYAVFCDNLKNLRTLGSML